MKPKLSQLLAMAPVALAAIVPMRAKAAAVDYFLQIEGVEAESTDKTHPKWIPLETCQFSISNSVSATAGAGSASGKVSFSDFSAAARISKASPTLYLNAAGGVRLKSALLAVRKSGAGSTTDFYTVKLEDVLITSVQTAGRSGELPLETTTLSFSKVTWAYRVQKADGSYEPAISKSWDVKTGKGS